MLKKVAATVCDRSSHRRLCRRCYFSPRRRDQRRFQQREHGLHERLFFWPTTGGGHYTVGNNPKTWNSFLSAYGDHTTGTGQMMIVDGSGTANTPIWTESLAVTPNTQYTFAFWAASCGNDNANGIDPSPAILVAKVNGTAFGSAFHVSATNGTWSQFAGTFNSGANSTMSLSIADSNTMAAPATTSPSTTSPSSPNPPPFSAAPVVLHAAGLAKEPGEAMNTV